MKRFLPSEKHFLPIYKVLSALLVILAFNTRSQAQAIIGHSKMIEGVGTVPDTEVLLVEGAYSYVLLTGPGNTLAVTTGSVPSGGQDKSAVVKLDTAGNYIWARYLPFDVAGTTTTFNKMILNNGVLYLLGSTTSAAIATTNGSTAGGGGSDILFTKIDAANGALLHNGYLGGNGAETIGLGLVLENGNAYITYASQSSNIPVTTGPAYTSGFDHVVQKLNASGNVLYSTYTGNATQTSFHTDSVSLVVENGNAYLATVISSTNNFSTTNGSSVKGPYDLGVVKLDASGNRSFAAVIGGTGTENKTSLVVSNGEMYISGMSTSVNFPVTNGTAKSSFPVDLVITKLNSSGATIYSGYYAGLGIGGTIQQTPETPVMKLNNGSLYITGGSFGATTPSVVMNTTDGSTGKHYLQKLDAASGTVQFASLFGATSQVLSGKYGAGLAIDNGFVYVLASPFNGNNSYTTDGSTRTGQSGTFIAKYTTAGQLVYASWITGGNFGNTFKVAAADDKVYISGGTSGNYPLTQIPSLAIEAAWTVLSFCPPMPTTNTITPLTQTICQEGFTQTLTGNEVVYASSQMPILYRNQVPTEQKEIRARYQWQVASSAAGPWTDIGALGTQRDYTPPTGTVNRYYRRLVLPPLGCGDSPVSTSATAEVLVGSNTAPSVTGGLFTTCFNTPVNISATASGGTTPYSYTWDNGITSTTNTATVTPTSNSVYTVTVTDANGCQQIGQAIVNAYNANAGPDTVSSCNGTAVRIGAAPPAGLAGVTYAWTPATGLDDPSIAQPLATPAATTKYFLQMTIPASGGGTCSTIDSIVVRVVAAPATANFAGPDQATCKGGTLNLGTPAEAGFTYTWSPGNYLTSSSGSTTTFNAGTELPQPNPFTYTLTASQLGCNFTDRVTVSALDVDAGDDYCGPRTVGTADKMPGVTGKTFLWEVLSGTGTITGSTNTPTTTVSASSGSSTSYRVTVSYLGASCMDTVVVAAGCGGGCPDVEIDVEAPHGCPSAALGPVTLKAIPSNLSAAQWTYSWSAVPAGGLSASTGNTVTLTDNVERDVTVTITRVDNPLFTCSETIHVNGPSWAAPVFTGLDKTICPGSTVSLGAPVGGYTYTWQNVNPGDENLDNPSVTPSATTEYPVLVEDVTSGCTLNDTVRVAVVPLVLNPGPDWITCSNALITLGTPAIAGYTYSWSPQVANYQNGTTYQSAQPQVLVATSQDFTLTVTDTQTGCSDDSTVNIIIDPGSSLPPMSDTTICPGGTATIGMQAQPGVTYSWSPATGLSSTTVSSPDASPASTQTYTLTVTYYDAGGAPTCTKSGQVTVNVNAPQITMNDDAICPSGPLYNLGTGVTVTGASSYAWSPSSLVTNASQLNTTVRNNPTVPTTFTLRATDANGCTATASRVISPINPAPEAGSGGFVCVGDSRTLGTVSNTGTLNWTVTPAFAGTLTPANGAQPVFTPATADANKTFTILVTQDIGGCINRDSVQLLVKNLSLQPMPAQTVCLNAPATIGVSPQPFVNYTWTPATGLNDPNASLTRVSNATSNTVYTLTATDNFGCSASGTAAVGVNPVPAPTVTIPDVTAIVGTSGVPFSPEISPMPASYSYSWTPANQMNNPYIADATAIPGSVGTYTYQLAVTDQNGCTTAAPATLNVIAAFPLPVTLSSFTGTAQGCGVRLEWKVASSTNFSHFVVERGNGRSFQAVGTIYLDVIRNSYSFNDADPGNGNWSYRLKLVDRDGQYTYSMVLLRTVDCNAKGKLVVYPNPVNDNVYIRSDKPVRGVMLISLSGQVILQAQYEQPQAGILQVSLNKQLAQGIYILQVRTTDGNIQYSKLVKQ